MGSDGGDAWRCFWRGERDPMGALISGLIGILVLLLVLWLIGILAERVGSVFLSAFAGFLFASAPLLILISVILIIARIFEAMPCPLNLIFPPFSAVAGLLLVSFLIQLVRFAGGYSSADLSPAIAVMRLVLYPLVFVVVLVAGYLSILARCSEGRGEGAGGVDAEKERTSAQTEEGAGAVGQEASGAHAAPTWKEIGEEFRRLCYDICRRMREEVRGK